MAPGTANQTDDGQDSLNSTKLGSTIATGPIGTIGTYDLDFDMAGGAKVSATVDAFKKDVLSWLSVDASGTVAVKADVVGAILSYASTSSVSFIQTLAQKLADFTGRTLPVAPPVSPVPPPAPVPAP